jgi:hypothetical protein
VQATIDNDLAGAVRISPTQVASSGDADDGVTRETDLVKLTRSFPSGHFRGGARFKVDQQPG